MFLVRLQGETDFAGWRDGARALRLSEVPPERATWRVGQACTLFDGEAPPSPPPGRGFAASRAFVDLAQDVILHRTETRFDLLYRLLWRLKDAPHLLEVSTDRDVSMALRMQRQVRDAEHKMHAFLRFRRADDPQDAQAPETYVAWFEPAHHVVERAADFFVDRMANLRFSILTPEVCAHWSEGELSFSPGVDGTDLPESGACEGDWRAYFAAVFNPARANAQLMTQHMPKRYWRNMPETEAIASLLLDAEGRARAMVQADPTEPSPRARRKPATAVELDPGAVPESLAAMAEMLQACRRCDLWREATQAVAGQGPSHAPLMFVGEQPGDVEDLRGQPFVGPAGQLLDRALAEAGVPRPDCYVTNAVKHFKHEPRGKRRIHQRPNAGEVKACRWWLDHERRLVKPRVIVALGATAASSVFGRSVSVTRERGPAGEIGGGAIGFVTVHPSFLLRLPDAAAKAREYELFVRDLRAAYGLL